jgi:long-chain acyl-CoA synthetase
VIGLPHPKRGEAVKAVVALEPGQSASAEELIAFCKERIAGYKCPRSIDFAEELPKSTVGKILRKDVKKWYSDDQAGGD